MLVSLSRFRERPVSDRQLIYSGPSFIAAVWGHAPAISETHDVGIQSSKSKFSKLRHDIITCYFQSPSLNEQFQFEFYLSLYILYIHSSTGICVLWLTQYDLWLQEWIPLMNSEKNPSFTSTPPHKHTHTNEANWALRSAFKSVYFIWSVCRMRIRRCVLSHVTKLKSKTHENISEELVYRMRHVREISSTLAVIVRNKERGNHTGGDLLQMWAVAFMNHTKRRVCRTVSNQIHKKHENKVTVVYSINDHKKIRTSKWNEITKRKYNKLKKQSWWDEWQAAMLFNSQTNLTCNWVLNNTDIFYLIVQNVYMWKLL